MENERVLTDLFILFVSAHLAAHVARRLGQPSVVGEILAGALVGPHLLGLVSGGEFFQRLSEIGVIILLFYVGLETQLRDLVRVGKHSSAVALLGVLLPFAAGFYLMRALGYTGPAPWFVATALVATSVGITARVLVDLGQSQSRPARVILGAAVLDDILGLLVLTLVMGLASRSLSWLGMGLTFLQALAFIVFVILVGRRLVRRFSMHAGALRIRDPEFVIALALCLGLSAAATSVGLAALVGAFLAGLVLSEARESRRIRLHLEPIYDFLVPLFFAIMGSLVDLRSLARPEVLLLTLAVTAVAVGTKFLGCGLASLSLGRRDALLIAIGMIPRGEVGIVVAMVGLRQGGISPAIYSVIVAMSVLTTLLVPPLLSRFVCPPQTTAATAKEEE